MGLKIKDFSEVYNVKDVTTERMKKAIADWYDLYFSFNVHYDETNSLKLAFTVVSKIQKAVFSEYSITPNGKNEQVKEIIKALDKVYKKAMQQALIGGICWLKPNIFGEKLAFSVISRDNVIILGRDEFNNVIDIGTEEDVEENGFFYTLFERRYVDSESGNLVIDTRLFESKSRDVRGNRVPLNTLSRYSMLVDINEIPINNIGLIPLVCPAENCVDGSDDAVSVYAAAVERIHDANINEKQLMGEFQRGESRVFASADILKKTATGDRELVDNLFVGLDDDPSQVGMTVFAPTLRDGAFLTRKLSYLRDIENIIGLKRGVLSDVEAQERTATEITSSAGEYNLTIIDFQDAWEETAKEAIVCVAGLKTAYRQPSFTPSDDDVIITWGDGILYNRDKTWAEYAGMVQMGLLKPEIAVAWYFNLPHETPEDIEAIKMKYMPQLQQLVEDNGEQ